MTVLVVSTLSDVHTCVLMEALAARGAAVEFVDLSDYPSRLAISIAFDGRWQQAKLRRRGGGFLDFKDIRSVWWWRPQSFRLPYGMPELHRRFSLSEATTAFQGLCQTLEVLWINNPVHQANAGHKPYQLRLAQKIGLVIPPTLMTNDVQAAQDFFRAYDGGVIYKQFVALPDTWRETRVLSADDQSHAESIALAPVIFQAHVSAVADLRVIVVAGEVYAAAADVREKSYPQDVLMNLDATYVVHALPAEPREKIKTSVTKLSLVYAAIDMRLTEDGVYVFLWINPAGQFLYIERATGLPITDALAKALAGKLQ